MQTVTPTVRANYAQFTRNLRAIYTQIVPTLISIIEEIKKKALSHRVRGFEKFLPFFVYVCKSFLLLYCSIFRVLRIFARFCLFCCTLILSFAPVNIDE